jgi:hypothetical protein
MAKTWQIILATIAIFLAGLVTGGATALGVVHWVSRHRDHGMDPAQIGPFSGRQGAPQAQQFGPQLMRSFADRLDLTEDQRDRIAPIVRSTVVQLGIQRREVQVSSALAIERMQDEISRILRPDQRGRFDELIHIQRERLREFRMRARAAAEESGQPMYPQGSK